MIASNHGYRYLLRNGVKVLQRWYYIPNDDIANVMDCVGEWRDEST